MLRAIAALASLLLACSAFAQGGGLKLKPSTEVAPPQAPAPAPAAAPAPAPPPAAKPEPAAGPAETNAGVASLERIFSCLSVGLPKDWKSATVEVIEIASKDGERQFEAKYSYTRVSDPKPVPLDPCDTTGPAKAVHGLNDFLEVEKRQWKRALLVFNNDGKFDLKYDYTPPPQ